MLRLHCRAETANLPGMLLAPKLQKAGLVGHVRVWKAGVVEGLIVDLGMQVGGHGVFPSEVGMPNTAVALREEFASHVSAVLRDPGAVGLQLLRTRRRCHGSAPAQRLGGTAGRLRHRPPNRELCRQPKALAIFVRQRRQGAAGKRNIESVGAGLSPLLEEPNDVAAACRCPKSLGHG